METNFRRIRCRLCREEGHNYRTCGRVEVIHRDLIYLFRRIIVNNAIMTVEEGMQLRCEWLQDYNLVALRALARKHNIGITYSKEEYCSIFKRLYLALALEEILNQITRRHILHNLMMQFLVLQEEHEQLLYREMRERQLPPIQLNKNEDMTDFDCPVCLEPIVKDEHKLKLNCGHRFCEPCIVSYLNILERNLDNFETLEECIPKCPLCRSNIVLIEGNVYVRD